VRAPKIRFILLQNRQGRTRLAKYYVPLDDNEKRKLEYDIHRLVVNRDPKFTNFLEVCARAWACLFTRTRRVCSCGVRLRGWRRHARAPRRCTCAAWRQALRFTCGVGASEACWRATRTRAPQP
jgi:AP-2 complex subunit sigma-1